jgi:hypothetical protein
MSLFDDLITYELCFPGAISGATEIACQIQAAAQGPGTPHYDEIELPAHEVGQRLSRMVQENRAGPSSLPACSISSSRVRKSSPRLNPTPTLQRWSHVYARLLSSVNGL